MTYQQLVPVEYYKSMPIEKNTIKFRFVKFQLNGGKWLVWHNPSVDRLRRLFIKHNPKNAYISVQKFLYFKEHNNTYKNLQIGNEELIDIDGQKFKDKREVWAEASKVTSFLRTNGAKINDFVVTNSSVGGYQISIDNPSEKLINDLSHKFNIDKKVLNDKKRVKRLVWSYNKNKNSFSYRAGMRQIADDNLGVKTEHRHKTKSGIGNCTNLPRHYAYKQISSSVQGTRGLYVPVFKFAKMPSKKRIGKLQLRYKTGSLILNKFLGKHYLIGIKTHQASRIRKMYRYMKCDYSLNEFDKFKQNMIPIGNAVDLDNKGKIISDSFDRMEYFTGMSNGLISIGHYRALVQQGVPLLNRASCGEEQPVYTVIFRREE